MSAKAPSENASTNPAKKSTDAATKPAQDLPIPLVPGAIIFIVLALVIYWPAIQGSFIWDDDTMLTDNPLIRDMGHPTRANPQGLSKIWFSTDQADYFPLTYSSFWIEWHYFGMQAKGYHVINVLLHALSAVCFWRVLRLLKLPGAFLAGLIFLVHPVNVESAAWIAERKNTLSIFFFALALVFYLRFETGRLKNPNLKINNWYWFTLYAFALSLLAKTAGVMFPFVALGCTWWLQGKVTKRDVMRTIPFFVISLALGLTTIFFQYNRAINVEVVDASNFLTRLARAGWNVWFYLYKLLWPAQLIFVYPRWEVDFRNALSYLPGITVVGLLLLFWLKRATWGRSLFLSFGYYVVVMFPILGFFNIYFFKYSFVADHYQTIAMISIIALMVAGLMRYARGAAVFILVAMVAALSSLTYQQAKIYKNPVTLWTDTMKKNPRCSMGESNWGYYLAELRGHDSDAEAAQHAEEALPHYYAALKIKADDFGTHYNLGVAYTRLGRVEEAMKEFRETLRLNPDHLFSLQSLAWLEATSKHPNLRNPQDAVRLALHGVELTHEQDEWKIDTLAAAYAATGDFAKAMQTQTKAIDLATRKRDFSTAEDMRRRLMLYQHRQVYIEPD